MSLALNNWAQINGFLVLSTKMNFFGVFICLSDAVLAVLAKTDVLVEI